MLDGVDFQAQSRRLISAGVQPWSGHRRLKFAARLQIASVSCTNEWHGRNLRHLSQEQSHPLFARRASLHRPGSHELAMAAAQLGALTPPGNGRSSNNTRALAAMHAPTTNAAAGPPTIQITPALALAPNAVTPIATS
jgi:hypothetical protein